MLRLHIISLALTYFTQRAYNSNYCQWWHALGHHQNGHWLICCHKLYLMMIAYFLLSITLKPRPMQRWEDAQVGMHWWCWPFSVTCCHGWTCRYNWLCMATVDESWPAEEGACYKYNIALNGLLHKDNSFFVYKISLWSLILPFCHPSIQFLTDNVFICLKKTVQCSI